jgi:hypothetical protein
MRGALARTSHHLLVVRDHEVVGIVTSLDLLKLLAGDVKSRGQESRAGRPAADNPSESDNADQPFNSFAVAHRPAHRLRRRFRQQEIGARGQ